MENEIVLSLPNDLHKFCRTCMMITKNEDTLSHDVALFDVDKTTIAGDMLQFCLTKRVTADDGLPKSICLECATKLEIAYNFKNQCEHSAVNLRDILNIQEESITDDSLNNQNNVNETKGIFLCNSNLSQNYIDEELETDNDDGNHIDIHILSQELIDNNNSNTNDENIGKSLQMELSNENEGCSQEQVKNNNNNVDIISKLIQNRINSSRILLIPNIKEEIEERSENKLTDYLELELNNPDYQNERIWNNPITSPADLKPISNDMLSESNESENDVKNEQTNIKCIIDTKNECDLCNKTYVNEMQLVSHFYRHARSSNESKPENMYQCYVCDEEFESKFDYDNHIEHHANFSMIQCDVCSDTVIGVSELKKHLMKHSIEMDICALCLERFEDSDKFNEHMNEHNLKRKKTNFQCPICKIDFNKCLLLKLHSVEQHRDDSFQCKRCKRTFTNKLIYDNHLSKHVAPRYLCALCGKQYFTNITLQCHLRSHNNEKPFQCTTCKKHFSSRATLSVHKRIHSVFKPFVCSYCGYRCHQGGDLAIHVRIHTGARPYACKFPDCDRTFRTSSHRWEHYRRHTNERKHKCGVCEKTFLESKTLKVHMLTHTGERPHLCTICGKKFRRVHHLNTHMKSHREHPML